jgi:hypothetical protein
MRAFLIVLADALRVAVLLFVLALAGAAATYAARRCDPIAAGREPNPAWVTKPRAPEPRQPEPAAPVAKAPLPRP